MENGKTMIEVNGVKLEVDLRTARRVDELRVGDRVKVLVKNYDGHGVHPGVVVGFEPFERLPTIIVAYIINSWASVELKFLHFNAQTKETEIIKAIDNDALDIDKERVLSTLDRQIQAKERELEDLQQRKTFFMAEFKNYWRYEGVETPETTA